MHQDVIHVLDVVLLVQVAVCHHVTAAVENVHPLALVAQAAHRVRVAVMDVVQDVLDAQVVRLDVIQVAQDVILHAQHHVVLHVLLLARVVHLAVKDAPQHVLSIVEVLVQDALQRVLQIVKDVLAVQVALMAVLVVVRQCVLMDALLIAHQVVMVQQRVQY